jgi:dephospho-CoA kinase
VVSVGLTGNFGAAEGAVLREFPEAAAARGGLDRDALARVVFDDPQRRRRLESLLHPLVVAESRRRLAELEAAGTRLAVTEAALLLEAARTGTAGEASLERFDAIVVVTCDPAVQRARAIARALDAGRTRTEAEADLERRLAAQLPQREKAAAADWIVDNSGSLSETRRQVKTVHEALVDGREAA